MAAGNERPIGELLGDFYGAHASGNTSVRATTLKLIQNRLFMGDTDAKPFLEYYNEIFSGRTSYNTLLNIADYPKESVMRELLQNALGCHYSSEDIKIIIDFLDDNTISLSYNEVGFSMEDILFYLSFGRNSGDSSREGRFGVGAKSVFMNVEWLSLRSNNFSFKIEKQGENLEILELNLLGVQFKGTRVMFKVNKTEYDRIKNDFEELTERRGDYINLIELCFGFNRKKVLDNRQTSLENDNRTVNIAVMNNGKPSTLYKIQRYQKTPEDAPVIRFLQNNKSIIDFLFYENEGFVYLIPYAVANTKRESIVKILLEKYNYFSTFELTGLLKSDSEKFIEEKLSAFFVSVPNSFITACRTGIKAECEEKVRAALERDLPAMLEQYNSHFVIELLKNANDDWFLCPKSYAFEFFRNFMQTSKYAESVRGTLIENVSLLFPDNAEAIPYPRIRENAFKTVTVGLNPEAQDEDVDKRYLDAELKALEESLSELQNKTLYVGYAFDGEEKNKDFIYKFERDGKSYVVDSRKAHGASDYDLYKSFPTIAGYKLKKYIEKDSVLNEAELEELLSIFDTCFNEDYELSMKQRRFEFESDGEVYSFDMSAIKIENINSAMLTLSARKNRITTTQNYNEIVTVLVNSFTQGKDTITFLREIKEQGGVVTLEADFNNNLRFCAYERQFIIPGLITNAELFELIGDLRQLVETKILVGRDFSFDTSPSKYSFEEDVVASLLSETNPEVTKSFVAEILPKLEVLNLQSEYIALVGDNNKVVAFKEIGDEIDADERERTTRYVVLRDDYSKAEFACVLEYILTGSDSKELSCYFSATKTPNVVIPDQIALSDKPLPQLSKADLDYAIESYNSVKDEENRAVYNSYFAKDINTKLHGFGGACQSCGYTSRFINPFSVKEFSIGLLDENVEKIFHFALYLCANDASLADGWFFKDIAIGGMNPFEWLEEITAAEVIPPEFFTCTIKYCPQMAYDIAADGNSYDSIVEGPEQTLDVCLTPLMAAKWIADNK